MVPSVIPRPNFGEALYLSGELESSPADNIAASSSLLVGSSIGARFCGVVCCTGFPHIEAAPLTDEKLWFSLSASVAFSGGKGLSWDLETAVVMPGRALPGSGRLKPEGWREEDIGEIGFDTGFVLTGELAEEARTGSLKGAGVSCFSVAVDDGVLSAGFAGVIGLGFSAPADAATSSEDLAETGVFGLSDRIGGNVIDFVGVRVLGFSASASGGLERLIDAALTAADLGRGCTGVLVTGELGDGKSIDLAE
jgi:hypothetical protein